VSDAYRIVVDVTGDPAGWRVTVREADGGPELLPPYRMDAVEVNWRRVPKASAAPLPPGDDLLAALCRGDVEEIGQLLDRLRMRDAAPNDVAHYGRWLFHCLLAPAWAAIRGHAQVRAARGVELALRFDPADTDLHRLIWEAMRDDRAPLAGHPELLVAITRLVPAEPATIDEILDMPRVLFAAGSRLADPTIRPGAMYMGLLRELDARGWCRAWALQATTLEALQEQCAELHPDIVHVVAHGAAADGRTVLLMGPEQAPVEADDLLTALTAGARPPIAAVISACNTASAATALGPGEAAPLSARLVAGGIPIVVAMSGEVSEPACRQFTRRLTDGVHSGKSVVVASAHGRRAALVGTESTELDWALPALFLNEHVRPATALVNPARADQLSTIARDLGLYREPMFVGRADILKAADRLVAPASAEGVVAVLATSSMSRLGGTRLLQEVGWRLLRAGHVPILLGSGPRSRPPVRPYDLVYRILKLLVQVGQNLNLAPIVPVTLREAGPEPAPIDTGQGPDEVRRAIRQRINLFLERKPELDVDILRDSLAADLTALATAASRLSKPFGAATTPVLLCPNVHLWADAGADGGALGFLLDMLRPASGLGTEGRRVPVMFTGSRTDVGGTLLNDWSRRATDQMAVLNLLPLEQTEARLGYQWVLLHPWQKPLAQSHSRIYTSHRDTVESWEKALAQVDLHPESVTDRLYEFARIMTATGAAEENDDEQAWKAYVDQHAEYQL